jgi:hypothetical protein
MDADWPAGDTRGAPQRRVDALGRLCRRHLDGGMPVQRRRTVRPHLSVVVDLGELEATGRASAGLVAQVRNEAAHTGRVSSATLERLSCDCDVSRIITDGVSQVLDVGRATRTVSPATWNALVARDGGCTSPGCDRGAHECEAHHLVHWARGGATSLDNLQLRCHACHRAAHRATAHKRRRE